MPSSNRRKLSRQKVSIDANLIDKHSGRQLGKLVDIHSEGLMILSHNGVNTDTIYQASLIPSEPYSEIGNIDLGLSCIWKRDLEQEHGCWAGFKIIAISDAMQQRIDQLIQLLNNEPEPSPPEEPL